MHTLYNLRKKGIQCWDSALNFDVKNRHQERASDILKSADRPENNRSKIECFPTCFERQQNYWLGGLSIFYHAPCPLGRKQQAGSKDWWYWAATFLNYNHPETEKNVNNSPHYTESPITDGSVSLRSFAIPVLRELGERRAFIVGDAWLRRQGSGGEGHISGFAESHSDQSTSMEVGGGELKWMVRMLVEN